jgi:hypothetical protein
MLALHEIPHGRRRGKIEIRPRAISRLAGPSSDINELLLEARVIEQTQGTALRDSQTSKTQVVRPSLDEGDPNIGEKVLQHWDVFTEELLLQMDRVSRDNDAPIGLFTDGEHGGDEIGERFSHPGARLDEEVLGRLNGVRHGRSHLDLLGTAFEFGQPATQLATRAKNVFRTHGIIVARRGFLAKSCCRLFSDSGFG